MAAAVTEASLITDQHLLWPESMAVRASRRRVDDPRADRSVDEAANLSHSALLLCGVSEFHGLGVTCTGWGDRRRLTP